MMKGKVTKTEPKVAANKLAGSGAVNYSFTGNVNAPLSISVDFRLATPPEAYVYADSVSLANDPQLGMASILFGQHDPRQNKECECMIVAIPSQALFTQFLSAVSTVEENLTQGLKAMGLEAARRQVPEGCRVRATLFANVISMYAGQSDCSLDFYYLPVRDVHIAKQFKTEIGLEPVLRVLIAPTVLKFLFELCHQRNREQLAIMRNEHRANSR
jgi:hypothetical protein